jgi:thioredoxin-dependent peroxiredoxin
MEISQKTPQDKTTTHLKKGDKAPDFSGVDQNGKTIALKDFKGKRLVLYFYPKDDSAGCTEQAKNLRDNYEDLKQKNIEVVGVSADDEESHQKFVQKNNLPFRLIADTDKAIINAYGVWGEKIVSGKKQDGILRTTFIIDEPGTIENVISNVNTSSHTEQILTAINSLKI